MEGFYLITGWFSVFGEMMGLGAREFAVLCDFGWGVSWEREVKGGMVERWGGNVIVGLRRKLSI